MLLLPQIDSIEVGIGVCPQMLPFCSTLSLALMSLCQLKLHCARLDALVILCVGGWVGVGVM